MNGRKQRQIGSLLLLLLLTAGLLVACLCLFALHGLRGERLSAQLMETVKDARFFSNIHYDPEEDKDGQERASDRAHLRLDEENVVRLLQAGADPNVRDFPAVKRTLWEEIKFLLKRMFRRSPPAAVLPPSVLTIAVQADNAVLVTALLKAGANDVNAEIWDQSGNDRFPLVNYAAYKGDLEIVQALCAHGADIHKLNSEGKLILQSALEDYIYYLVPEHVAMDAASVQERKRRAEIFHLLLAKGATYQAQSQVGQYLLCAAAEGDYLALARELLIAGVSANAKTNTQKSQTIYTPLDYAVANDDMVLVKLLLQYGASVSDDRAEAPILQVRSPEMARLLLEQGADIHATQSGGNYQGENALNFACGRGDTKVVLFLIEHGLPVNSGGEHDSPVDQAAEYGGYETVRLLLQHGAKVGPNSPGSDALFLAIAESYFDSAKLILRYGAAVNAKDGAPLGEAARQDNSEIALELLKRGADPNANGGEALLEACASCNEDLVEILLEHGADPNVRAADGTTAIQTAKESANPPNDADGIIALLKDYGAKR